MIFLDYLIYRHLPLFVSFNLIKESSVEEDLHNLQLFIRTGVWGTLFYRIHSLLVCAGGQIFFLELHLLAQKNEY